MEYIVIEVVWVTCVACDPNLGSLGACFPRKILIYQMLRDVFLAHFGTSRGDECQEKIIN